MTNDTAVFALVCAIVTAMLLGVIHAFVEPMSVGAAMEREENIVNGSGRLHHWHHDGIDYIIGIDSICPLQPSKWPPCAIHD